MILYQTLRKQAGISIVEFALVLPFMMLLLLVALDFGRVMYASIITSHAASTAVGYGSLNSILAMDHSGMVNAAETDASDLVADENNPDPVTTSVRHFCYCPGSTQEVNCTSSCSQAPEMYVEATVTRQFTTLIDYPGIPNQVELQRTAVFRVQ